MTPEEFLEHHGVKGMRWGVRKAVAKGRSNTYKYVQKNDQKHKENSKARKEFYRKHEHAIKEGLAWTAAIVGGAVAGHYLAKAGGKKLSEIRATNVKTDFRGMEKLLKSNAQMTQSGMRRSRLSAQAMHNARKLADFDKFHKEIVSKANADLLAGYTRNMTPFPLREFI